MDWHGGGRKGGETGEFILWHAWQFPRSKVESRGTMLADVEASVVMMWQGLHAGVGFWCAQSKARGRDPLTLLQ